MRGTGPSPFKVILVTAALSLVGLLSLGGLNLRYTPEPRENVLSVRVSFPDASPTVMEAEITSRIEAVLSCMRCCRGISSTSSTGSGSVRMELSRGTDLEAARFEASTKLANLWPSLPKGTTYPSLSVGGSGSGGESLVWRLRSPRPAGSIARYAQEHLVDALASVPGVENTSVSGDVPYVLEITFDYEKARTLGITGADIVSAVQSYGRRDIAGMLQEGDRHRTVVIAGLCGSRNLDCIPVKGIDGRVVRLGDISSIRYKEGKQDTFFRLNGLNTVTLGVTIAEDANVIVVARDLRDAMEILKETFPEDISADLAYDSSEYVSRELWKIILRTLLCLAILLVFSFLINRSWRQMLILMMSLAAGLLVAAGIYRIAGLPVHIYTLAGITVAFGIMIDTSIMMTDHYARFRNRAVFSSLLYAVLTTVAALSMILLLPQKERIYLSDFMWAIVINLGVSLCISFFFVPAMMEILPGEEKKRRLSRKRILRRAKALSIYGRYIGYGTHHRWVYILAGIAAFGIPLYLIPSSSQFKEDDSSLIAKISRWEPYNSRRQFIDKIAGSASGLFYRSMDRSYFYREPERKTLLIRAGLPEGCTVEQLNEVMLSMENFLARFDQIESFSTNISSPDNGTIEVRFKKEYEQSAFPSQLKAEVTAAAISFGGANWTVSGVDDNYFNNNIVTDAKSDRIILSGYNWDELHDYARALIARLEKSPRVGSPEIWAGGWWGRPGTQLHLDYNREALAAMDISPRDYYNALGDRLFSMTAGQVLYRGQPVEAVVVSDQSASFDRWHVENVPIPVDSTEVSLSAIGSIKKRRSAVDIKRENQAYTLAVCYDFVGSWQLSRKVANDAVNYMNEEILPVGYKAKVPGWGMWDTARENYLWLILIIMLVIFAVLAIAFESVKYPLAVIFMVPLSFIGLFLVFGLGGFPFDRGGFASLVMLSGIVVNAGIYIVSSYQSLLSHCESNSIKAYLKAFRIKIFPIFMTILSTVLGLLPFLSDGPSEVFWFDFAIGTIGGLAMSVLILLFFFPVFVCTRIQS